MVTVALRMFAPVPRTIEFLRRNRSVGVSSRNWRARFSRFSPGLAEVAERGGRRKLHHACCRFAAENCIASHPARPRCGEVMQGHPKVAGLMIATTRVSLSARRSSDRRDSTVQIG